MNHSSLQRISANGFWYWKTNSGYCSAIKVDGKMWYAKDADFYENPDPDFIEPNDEEFIKLFGG